MCCLITVESMLSAVAVSSLMKGLSEYESINRYYLPGVTTGPHIIIWKRKQNSSKHFGFREVSMNIIIHSLLWLESISDNNNKKVLSLV